MACTNQCLFLTDDEVTALIAQGWTHVSDYDNQDECLAACCSSSSHSSQSTVVATCCSTPERPLPYRWKVTLSGITDNGGTNCSALNGTWILEWNPNSTCLWWVPVPTTCFLCGGPCYLRLSPLGGEPSTTMAFYGLNFRHILPCSEWNWDGPNVMTLDGGTGGCCNWPMTITIEPA